MEKFEIKNRYGLKIVGEIRRPENPSGLVFVLHGLGGYKEQQNTVTVVDTFFTNNYIVINFDATNSVGESEGKYENATMQLHYEDLVDVISWGKNQDWYNEPFVLAGHSLGGYAVAKYSEDYPNEVKAVFPFALVVSGELSYEANKKYNSDSLGVWEKTGWREEFSNSKPGLLKRLPWSHMQERFKHDLIPLAHNITMPVLFVVGENDKSCPPDQEKMLYDALPGNTNNEFHVVHGASHTFRNQIDLDNLKEILDNWIKKLK